MRQKILVLLIAAFAACSGGSGQLRQGSGNGNTYFPPPDSMGGWRTLNDAKKIKKVTGVDKALLDSAFEYIRTTTKNGGLLVVRHGYLIYENYFGKGQRDATPNLGSCGKSFTGISIGILMNEHPELFPDGLEQKVFTPAYLPAMAFPLADPRMADIKLGQLLAFTGGIRGNNPVYINGVASKIDPVGPDGWYALVDEFALGKKNGDMNRIPFTTSTLWCKPGGGYSYATASIHIASIILRHLTGSELESYVRSHLAIPLGWGTWGYGYKNQPLVTHTPGGGGIAMRSTDMLRFCYMLLHHGKWGNNQVVPAEYIKKATNASPYNPHYPYSLQFTVNTNANISELPEDTFWKPGSGGHCFYVVPSLDLIVWKMGGRDGQYSKNDTGLPQPGINSSIIGPTAKITATLDGSEYARTLELIINSITDKSK